MTRKRLLKFGWIAPVLLVGLIATLVMSRGGPSSESRSRHAPSKARATERESFVRSDSRIPRTDLPARSTAGSPEQENGAEIQDRSAADVIASDPLKSTLRDALARFSALKSYTYSIRVSVHQEGRPVVQTTSTGQVKDQEIVMGLTEIQGETFEVASRGAESRIRRLGEVGWSEAESGWYDAGEVDPRAATMAQAWADSVLASMPLQSAPQETVGGVPCRAMTLNLDGTLPDESSMGNCAVTFVVDDEGHIRRWRLAMEIVQDGKKLKTLAEADFSGFDATWMRPLPEWMQ